MQIIEGLHRLATITQTRLPIFGKYTPSKQSGTITSSQKKISIDPTLISDGQS